MQTVLLTGATGFLGSYIGEELYLDYKLIALKRKSSNLNNCSLYKENIIWIDKDESNWKEKIISYSPRIIIHTAWQGVEAKKREDWEFQTENLYFLRDIFYIAKQSNTKKIIALGSQAEYGYIESLVSENCNLKPVEAYGAVKVVASNLLEQFCTNNSIEWYWLRIFSVFGEREDINWFIPHLITTILSGKSNSLPLTAGEQKYAYLYARDFAKAIKKIVESNNNKSNIYNICSSKLLSIKDIAYKIKDLINPDFQLKFGELPYRENQSMLIAGNVTLFENEFGKLDNTTLEEGIVNTINYIKKMLKRDESF